MYSTKDAFIDDLRKSAAAELLDKWFDSTSLPFAFKSHLELDDFYKPIKADWPATEHLLIGGSGATGFSLNPEKQFKVFSEKSDIDVINVSAEHFSEVWERIRLFHRKHWYQFSYTTRKSLKRNGENIYSGFVSPKWILNERDDLRFKFVTRLQLYSNTIVKFRTVNMLFFKNIEEVRDYYRRGIEASKRII